MISEAKAKKLQANWGDKADALDCFAEVRVFDPRSSWEAFIYAQNPDYPDEVKAIIRGFSVEIYDISLEELFSSYNADGEHPEIDPLFRPVRADKLLKRLKEKYENQSRA